MCLQSQPWEGDDRASGSLVGQTRLSLNIQTHTHFPAHKHTHRKVNEHM